MKTTIKFFTLALIAAATLLGTKVKAQTTTPLNKWRFGIGIEGAIPAGTLKDYSNAVLGGTARLQYGLTKHVALMLTSGYYNAFGKTVPYTDNAYKYQSMGIVPVKVGVKAYLGNKLYVSAETGAGFEMNNNYQNSEKQTKLIWSGGAGYSLKHVDFGLRYESLSGDGNIYGITALRVAYGFGL
jgi:hypothetical protein